METHGIDLGAPLQTRQEIIADRLRDAILRGIFRPGQRLDQNEIAEVFKVSRSPIREALRTLAAEGLVEVIPHHGAIVAEGDRVILSFVREAPDPKDPSVKYTTTWFDMFRIVNGKIVEHWDSATKGPGPTRAPAKN